MLYLEGKTSEYLKTFSFYKKTDQQIGQIYNRNTLI